MLISLRTARLTGIPATVQDQPGIERIYAENVEILRLLDSGNDPQALAVRFVRRLNLPSPGSVDRLHNLVLREDPSSSPTGLLSVYLGYPRSSVAYVGELFLLPASQGRGLGRESYLGLESILRGADLRTVRVGVGLRNWNALRFWIRLGFQRITGMSGSRVYTPDTFAFLELQKNL